MDRIALLLLSLAACARGVVDPDNAFAVDPDPTAIDEDGDTSSGAPDVRALDSSTTGDDATTNAALVALDEPAASTDATDASTTTGTTTDASTSGDETSSSSSTTTTGEEAAPPGGVQPAVGYWASCEAQADCLGEGSGIDPDVDDVACLPLFEHGDIDHPTGDGVPYAGICSRPCEVNADCPPPPAGSTALSWCEDWGGGWRMCALLVAPCTTEPACPEGATCETVQNQGGKAAYCW